MTDEVREMCERLRRIFSANEHRKMCREAATLLERFARKLAEAREDAERLRGELDDVYAARASERGGEES